MKKFWMTGLMGMALAIQCSALTVDVSRVTGYWTSPGGEFNVANGAPSDPGNTALFNKELSHYSASTIVTGPNGVGFESFCNSGTTGVQPNPQNGVFVLSPVAWGTAWLFSQFAAGTLAGYDYNVSGSGGSFASRAAAAYALQNAIWELDGTGGGDLDSSAPGITVFLTEAASAAALAGISSDANAANGAFDVEELYLTYNGLPSQPLLGFGVPDGGSTIILLGMALTGIGLFTRRFLRA